jgi:hypothetical protein
LRDDDLRDDDFTEALDRQDIAALETLCYQLKQLHAPDSGNLADIEGLFMSLKASADVIERALHRAPEAPQLTSLGRELAAFLPRFNQALTNQPELSGSLDEQAIRSLCQGLSVCASPGGGVLFDETQQRRAGPALQGITGALLTQLAVLGMPEAASSNGVVLDILNWVSRGLKSELLAPNALIRNSYGRALELFAAWLGSDHTRGFLSVHQLAKCAVQVDLMVKRKLVALGADTSQGKANRALLAQCAMGLCSRAALERLETGPASTSTTGEQWTVDAVSLINLCNAVKTLLERGVLQAGDVALANPLSRLLSLILRLPSSQLCDGDGQTLSNCSNFVRTLFEMGIHAQPWFAQALPALEKACAHLIATVNGEDFAKGHAGSQTITNLISFVKLCDKRLQQAKADNDEQRQAGLIKAAGILYGQLMQHDPAAFRTPEAIGGLLSGLCYLWRRGLVALSAAGQAWMEALMRSMAGMDATRWSDKSRTVALPALQALIALRATTLQAAQPALAVIMREPARASSGYTLADLAQATQALGAVEEAVKTLSPDLIAALPMSEPAQGQAPAPLDAAPKSIPGLTRVIAPMPMASPLTSSIATPGASAFGRSAKPAWKEIGTRARAAQPPAPAPPVATRPVLRTDASKARVTPAWSSSSATAAPVATTTTARSPAGTSTATSTTTTSTASATSCSTTNAPGPAGKPPL